MRAIILRTADSAGSLCWLLLLCRPLDGGRAARDAFELGGGPRAQFPETAGAIEVGTNGSGVVLDLPH